MEGVTSEGDQRKTEASNWRDKDGHGDMNPMVDREARPAEDQHQCLVRYVKRAVDEDDALVG